MDIQFKAVTDFENAHVLLLVRAVRCSWLALRHAGPGSQVILAAEISADFEQPLPPATSESPFHPDAAEPQNPQLPMAAANIRYKTKNLRYN